MPEPVLKQSQTSLSYARRAVLLSIGWLTSSSSSSATPHHAPFPFTPFSKIQFLLAKEESPRVLSQSHSTVVTPPPVGKESDTLALAVDGTAWPPHRFVLCLHPVGFPSRVSCLFICVRACATGGRPFFGGLQRS